MKILDVPQSGSLGGVTSSHNRAGQYRRARRTPVSPTRTDKQGVIRGRFGSASAAWQSLASDLQAAWTAFAANYPVVDSLGQSIVLTGQQFFIGLQSSLMNAGQPMNTGIPVNTSVPAVDTPQLLIYADGTVIVSCASITPGDWNLVGLSKVLSNGKNFNKTFSQFAVLSGDNLVADISDAYARQFGAPVSGRKIFARFKEVNSDGMSGPPLILQSSVVDTSPLPTPALSAIVAGAATISWGGGSALNVTVFSVGAVGQPATVFQTANGIPTPLAITGCQSGTSYYARLSDGVNWSAKSATMIAP
jgi:hypothetical protein